MISTAHSRQSLGPSNRIGSSGDGPKHRCATAMSNAPHTAIAPSGFVIPPFSANGPTNGVKNAYRPAIPAYTVPTEPSPIFSVRWRCGGSVLGKTPKLMETARSTKTAAKNRGLANNRMVMPTVPLLSSPPSWSAAFPPAPSSSSSSSSSTSRMFATNGISNAVAVALTIKGTSDHRNSSKSHPPNAGPTMYPTPIADSRTPFANTCDLLGRCRVMRHSTVTPVPATAKPMKSLEQTHIVTQRVNALSVSFVSPRGGPAYVARERHAVMSTSDEINAALVPKRQRRGGTRGETSSTPKGSAAKMRPR
mmetsp:Transcript_12080/g.50832  ORF Transcript_12080/g.50832 Transcript_12080/m.50832 type:complete len:307 (-) Transcript_12080:322-1242(-)